MSEDRDEVLKAICLADPANEAEVETKVLLPLFRLLGYRDEDRADKPPVAMQFGRKRSVKHPDFVLYDGRERSILNALVAVEAKSPGVGIDEQAIMQVKSYALWAGTPLYLACDGERIVVSRFVPGADGFKVFSAAIGDLHDRWDEFAAIVQRRTAVLTTERLSFIAHALPDIEKLSPELFFKEYLGRLAQRFEGYAEQALEPEGGRQLDPRIPVHVGPAGSENAERWDLDRVAAECRASQRLLIRGESGSGKTTLCRRLASALAREASTRGGGALPIYLHLGDGCPSTVGDAFARACQDMGVRVFRALYEEALTRTDVVLILDGLDELPAPVDDLRRLSTLGQQAGDTSIVLTSRPEPEVLKHDALRGLSATPLSVRPLTSGEALEVATAYGLTDEEATALLADHPFVAESPMLLMMAIRVRSTLQVEVTPFRLYEAYVATLDSYFRVTRGRGGDPGMSGLLGVLEDAALLIRGRRGDESPVSLTELRVALQTTKDKGNVDRLFDTGLVTAKGSAAAFAHKSFEEFGLASRVLRGLRNEDSACVLTPHVTPVECQIVAPELDARAVAYLGSLLQGDDKYAAKRAVRLLAVTPRTAAADMLWRFLPEAKGRPLFKLVVDGLLQAGDPRIRPWIAENLAGLEPPVARSLAVPLRLDGGLEYAPAVLEFCFTNQVGGLLAVAAFDLALRHDLIDHADRLVAIYLTLGTRHRMRAASAIWKYTAGRLADKLSADLVEADDRPASLLLLLRSRALRSPEVSPADLSDAQLDRIAGVIRRLQQFNRRTRKRLRWLRDAMTEAAARSDAAAGLVASIDRKMSA